MACVVGSPVRTLTRIAGLYDIHGNLPALEATLAEVDAIGCDRIVVGGDVALGPMPRETLDLLLVRGDRVSFVRGIAMLEREPDPAKPLEARFRWAARSWRTTPGSAGRASTSAGGRREPTPLRIRRDSAATTAGGSTQDEARAATPAPENRSQAVPDGSSQVSTAML